MAGRSFQPPKWCKPPKHPDRRKQVLRLAGAAAAPGVQVTAKAVYTIGRSEDADLQLRGDLASRMHAAVLQDAEGRKFLVDLRSTHGTFLNERRLEPHDPVKWPEGARASFGPAERGAEVAMLTLAEGYEAGGDKGTASEDKGHPKRRRSEDDDGDELASQSLVPKRRVAEASVADLYGNLPEAKEVEMPKVVKATHSNHVEGTGGVSVQDKTKVVFLDVDGVLRPVHGRTDFVKNLRTMTVDGFKVALMGDGEAKAGIDFWPAAMRALRHIQSKTNACIVLSSDWRKEEVLFDGVNNALEEYRIPRLTSKTPDLESTAAPGVLKALHRSFQERRSKEIRKWLRLNPQVTRFVAIDDIDLSTESVKARREAAEDFATFGEGGRGLPSVFLDPTCEFVRCNPSVGLTNDLAKVAVCFMNGEPISEEQIDQAYANSCPQAAGQVQEATNPFELMTSPFG